MGTFKHTMRDEQTNRCRRFCVQTAQTRMNNRTSVPLEILNFAFVLLGGFLGVERAKVATLAGLRIFLPRIKSILSGFQFSDHDELLADEGSNHSTRMRISIPRWQDFVCKRLQFPGKVLNVCRFRATMRGSKKSWRTASDFSNVAPLVWDDRITNRTNSLSLSHPRTTRRRRNGSSVPR